MKPRHPSLAAAIALCGIGAAFGYHHLTTKAEAIPPAATLLPAAKPVIARSHSSANIPSATVKNNTSAARTEARVPAGAIVKLIDQVIADAIQRGTLDPNRLTPQQLALLPEKFRPRPKDDDQELSDEQIAHIEEQLALGDAAPADPPPQLPCPDPDHLPENYNNAYNKMILRERGCKL